MRTPPPTPEANGIVPVRISCLIWLLFPVAPSHSGWTCLRRQVPFGCPKHLKHTRHNPRDRSAQERVERLPCRQELDTGRRPMKAIVVTDQAAGMAGVKLMERPEPQAAINDVVVQIHASGFTGDELSWPSTWTDRVGRDRTPSIPGHELAGV